MPFVFHRTKSAASFTKTSRIITAAPWTSRSRVSATSRRARRRRRERAREGDRLVEDAGEPFRTAGAGRSGGQLRLYLDLEGTWPRRRASMNRSSDLPRALSRER